MRSIALEVDCATVRSIGFLALRTKASEVRWAILSRQSKGSREAGN